MSEVNTIDRLGDDVAFAKFVDRTIEEYTDDTLSIVGMSAFDKCYNLLSVSLPSVTEIDSYAFRDCANLTSVSLPALVSSGTYAFSGCSSLTNVSLPLLNEISQYMFSDCTALASISVPVATTIISNAFRNCVSLISVTFPSVTNFGSSVFYSCSRLESASFPALERITSSGSLAAPFNGCSSLTALILGNTNGVVEVGSGNPPLSGANNNCIIYVPDALVNDYKAADKWSTYASRIKGISELPTP